MNVRAALSAVLATVLAATPAAFAAKGEKLWLHLEVDERGGTELELTMPMSVVQLATALLPSQLLVDANIKLDGTEVELREVARLWRELRRSPDQTFLTVKESDGGRVRIAKSKGNLLLTVDEHRDRVEIRVPNRAVDALFAGYRNESEQLDVAGLVRVLATSGEGEILVTSGEDRVRIWIDGDSRE